MMWAYGWVEIRAHWLVFSTSLQSLSESGHEHGWRNAVLYALAFGAADTAVAVACYRPLAALYGRWAAFVAILLVCPFGFERLSIAFGQTTPVGLVSHGLHVVTAVLPLVFLTYRRQRWLAEVVTPAFV